MRQPGGQHAGQDGTIGPHQIAGLLEAVFAQANFQALDQGQRHDAIAADGQDVHHHQGHQRDGEKEEDDREGRAERTGEPGQQILFSHDYFTPLAQRLFLYFSSRISRMSRA